MAAHGEVVVRYAVAGVLAADAQEDRAVGCAVVVQELEVAQLELPVVLEGRRRSTNFRKYREGSFRDSRGCED